MQSNHYDKIIGSKINVLIEASNSENINFAATWQKLENTLHKKPRKIISIYYGAAASAIVLFCSIYFFANQSKNTKQNNGVVPVIPATSTTIKNQNTAINTSNNFPVTTHKQHPALVKEKITTHKVVIIDTATKNKHESTFTHLIITTSTQNNSNNNIIATVVDTDQPIIQTILLPTKASVKSKRKIYHISELEHVMDEQNFAENKKHNKKQVLEEEDNTTEPTKSFWQLKAKPISTAITTLTDNQ